MIDVRVGDCRALLPELPDASVDCCVTSPPYLGLRDYGAEGQIGVEGSLDEYVAALVGVLREVRRALKDDGTAWINLGDRYVPAAARARGALKPKDLMLVPARLALALQSDGLADPAEVRALERVRGALAARYGAWGGVPGPVRDEIARLGGEIAQARGGAWTVRSWIVWHKPNPVPEGVRDRPTCAHETVLMLAKSDRYWFDADAVREPHTMRPQRRPNGHKRRRPGPLMPEHTWSGTARTEPGIDGNPLGRNVRNVWTIATRPGKGPHPAMFPPELAERCVKAGCRPGGTVLDPFAGGGTTGLVADRLGRDAVLLEINPEYAEYARRRIAEDAAARR